MGVGSRMGLVGHLLRAAWNSSGKFNNYGKSVMFIRKKNAVVSYPLLVTDLPVISFSNSEKYSRSIDFHIFHGSANL